MKADANGPASVSVICRECTTLIKPGDLPGAVQSRVDREDGTWALQYDHPKGECRPLQPTGSADRPPMSELLGMLQ